MTYSSEVLADSPLAYWKLDETSGTTITDASGNGRHGTYSGTPTLGEPGLYTGDGGAARATSGLLGTIADAAWMEPSVGITVEAWYKANNANDVAGIVSRYTSGAGLWIIWQRRGRIGLLYWDGSAQVEIDGPLLVSGRTYHIAATISTTAMQLYVNGRLVVTRTISTTLATLQSNSNQIEFGGYAGAQTSLATLSDVALYDAILSPSRILAHYLEGGSTRVDDYSLEVLADSPAVHWSLDDTSGTSADIVSSSLVAASGNPISAPVGVYSGSPTLGASSLLDSGVGTAVTFDGTNDQMEATESRPFLAGTGQYTAEALFKTSTSSAGVIINRTSFGGSNRFQVSVESGAVVGRNINTSVTITSPASTYADNSVHHVALVQDATHLRLYVDGSEVVSAASINSSGSDAQIFYVGRGRYVGLEGYFTGTVDEVAIYPTALSSARIAAHYAATQPGVPSGTGEGTWGWTGSGSGSTDRTGTGTGTWGWAGSGTGSAPALVPTGSGSGVWGWAGSGSGSRTASGSGTGTWGWAGTGTGTADDGGPTGSGTGTWGWSGSGVGIGPILNNEFYPFRSQARMGYLTIPIPLPPPAHVDPVKVARYSHVAPALSEANPILTEGVDYPHADAVEVGTWHVFVGGVDVTYLGGAPIQSTRRSSRSPMGDVSATFEIPAMQAWTEPGEGDLYMLQPDAPVDMVLVDDLGNQTHLWRGFLSAVTSSVDATSETPTKSHTFIADGTLWQAGYALHEPPHYLPPTDIGTLIPDALNAVPGKRWSDIPRVTTGRLSRNRGSGNQSVMQWVDELLQKDGLEDNGGQWTLVEIAPGEFRLQLKAETTTYDYSVTYGAFGIEVDLTRDESMRVDVIYGRGIEMNGGQWRGTRFPGLVIATPPPYPNDPPTSLHLGDSDADTDSGDGVTLWQQRMVELGYTLTVDGVLNSNDIQVVRRLQARMGALVDGVIGPQTWAASFNRGPEGIDLTQWREPIAALPWTQEFYRDPSGIIISENPDYDPTRVQHQVEVDFGVNITWREAQPLAERMLEIESVPALTGTIRMVTDFHEAWRGLAKPGDRVRVVGFQGADVIVRVAAVDVSVGDDGMEVLLTVDERSRDAYNVEAILERNRDALPDPNRRPGSPSRASRLVQDRYVQWDIDSPCGFMPRTAVFGGLWVCPNPIPFAEVGRVVKTMLTCTVPFTLALFGLPVKPSQLHSIVGDPHTQDDPWVGEARVAALDALGWIESWGSQGERCGYSPNGQESNGAAFTGKFEEFGGFDFISGRPPYVWPALFSSTTGFIGGAEAGGYGRFYPDTSV